MPTSTGDTATDQLIEHQRKRRSHWLAQTPPDRKEADRCMKQINDFLDRRPRAHAVSTDGEIILNDQSPWVVAQGQAINVSGHPERVMQVQELLDADGGVE